MKSAMFHEDAEAELRAALDYYADQRMGLDGEFRDEFEAALERVCDNPLLYAAKMMMAFDTARYGVFLTRWYMSISKTASGLLQQHINNADHVTGRNVMLSKQKPCARKVTGIHATAARVHR